MICCPVMAQQEDSKEIAAAEVSDSIIKEPMAMPLNIPTLTPYGTMPTLRWYPFMWSGWHAWDVHEGLNAQIGASVFYTFDSGGRRAMLIAAINKHLQTDEVLLGKTEFCNRWLLQ